MPSSLFALTQHFWNSYLTDVADILIVALFFYSLFLFHAETVNSGAIQHKGAMKTAGELNLIISLKSLILDIE